VRAHQVADAGEDGGIFDRALDEIFAPRFELRFDQRNQPSARGGERQRAGQYQTQRNETDVANHRRGRRFEQGARQIARVQTFAHEYAAVSPQLLVELAMTDIDGVDESRAAREQHVGESAGRGANIEAIEAARMKPESVERRGELDAAPRDPRVRRLGLDDRAGRYCLRRLAQCDPIGPDETGLDGGLRARAALKIAAFDQCDIGALAHGPNAASGGVGWRR
jgi:hypothetical protein